MRHGDLDGRRSLLWCKGETTANFVGDRFHHQRRAECAMATSMATVLSPAIRGKLRPICIQWFSAPVPPKCSGPTAADFIAAAALDICWLMHIVRGPALDSLLWWWPKFGLIPGFRNTRRVCSELSSRDSCIDIRGGRLQIVVIPTIRSLGCYSAELVPNRNLIIAGLMNTNGRRFKVRFMRGFTLASKAFLVLDAVCMIGAGLRTERGAPKPR